MPCIINKRTVVIRLVQINYRNETKKKNNVKRNKNMGNKTRKRTID